MSTPHATAANLPTTRLGAQGLSAVSTIGLGCMGMSGMYGATDESLGALQSTLDDDLQQIQAALSENAVAGTRYAAQQMAHLDSEK